MRSTRLSSPVLFFRLFLWISQAQGLDVAESCIWWTCPSQDFQYAEFNNALNWSSAERACRQLGEGVHLATPRNSAESACVFERSRKQENSWIGLSQESVSQYIRLHQQPIPFRYIDNGQVISNKSYTNWTSGQPDYLWQFCVSAFIDTRTGPGQNQIGWDNDLCDYQAPGFAALCQRNGDAGLGGWTNCSHLNERYRLITDKMNWTNAKVACEKLGNGAHLATPRNPQQSQCVHEVRGTQIVWLGIAEFFPYVYADDNSELTYANWAEGQPANFFDDAASCAVAVESANRSSWISENCSTAGLSYICQRKRRCADAPQTLNNTLPVHVLDECGNQTIMSYQCRHGYSYSGDNASDTVRVIHCDGRFPQANLSCQDVDECALETHKCGDWESGGQCNNTAGNYTCSCRYGYTGAGNCSDVDECALGTHSCVSLENGGQCNNTVGSYTCSCRHGYMGTGMAYCTGLCPSYNFSHGQLHYELPPTDFGAFVEFSCNESDGYVLKGCKRLICLKTKVWGGSIPTCERVTCELSTAPDLDNGLIVMPAQLTGHQVEYGLSAVYACKSGYELRGNDRIMCTIDSWTELAGKCELINEQTTTTTRTTKTRTTADIKTDTPVCAVIFCGAVAGFVGFVLFLVIIFVIIKRRKKTKTRRLNATELLDAAPSTGDQPAPINIEMADNLAYGKIAVMTDDAAYDKVAARDSCGTDVMDGEGAVATDNAAFGKAAAKNSSGTDVMEGNAYEVF